MIYLILLIYKYNLNTKNGTTMKENKKMSSHYLSLIIIEQLLLSYTQNKSDTCNTYLLETKNRNIFQKLICYFAFIFTPFYI